MKKNTKLRQWKKYYKLNKYYHKDIQQLVSHLIPSQASVLEISCREGELLGSLPNKNKSGVDIDGEFIEHAKRKHSSIKFLTQDKLTTLKGNKYDYILLSHTSYSTPDIQDLIKLIKRLSHSRTRIIVTSFSFLWKPALDLGELVGLKLPSEKEPNWLTEGDIDNLFYLESFEKVKSGKRFLIPYEIPVISGLVNRYIAQLPLINTLCLTNYAVYRAPPTVKDYSVSIIIPARNEEGNMRDVLRKIPNLGKSCEVIFVEGHSKDETYETIKNEINKYKGPLKASLYRQKGIGKGDAVRLGFSKAKNELLMILDADLTVDPNELVKFYNAIASGKGDFVMGSRLVYPMQKQAMRILNYFGNKLFSITFTFLLGQRVKDTLCGTKVLLKDDYEKIAKNRKVFGDFDPFGDYDLIFGAANLNLKIIEIPIRYKERTYGTTNISRFTHGLLLLKMAYFAAKNLKFN